MVLNTLVIRRVLRNALSIYGLWHATMYLLRLRAKPNASAKDVPILMISAKAPYTDEDLYSPTKWHTGDLLGAVRRAKIMCMHAQVSVQTDRWTRYRHAGLDPASSNHLDPGFRQDDNTAVLSKGLSVRCLQHSGALKKPPLLHTGKYQRLATEKLMGLQGGLFRNSVHPQTASFGPELRFLHPVDLQIRPLVPAGHGLDGFITAIGDHDNHVLVPPVPHLFQKPFTAVERRCAAHGQGGHAGCCYPIAGQSPFVYLFMKSTGTISNNGF
jgi:hypothetical protein